MAKQNYQTRDSATDEIQPRTYAFLKHFHKFPVELADLQAQFEKLQDITNQLAGIPKISTTPHDINRHFDSNENLDVALLKFKSGREHNLDNINCNVSSPSNSELENNDFVELGMNELLANKVFDVLPEQDDNSYDNAEMVIYDDYKLIDVVQLPCELQKLDCYELEGEEVYATKVFEGLSESNIVADEVVFDDYDDDSHLSAHDLFVEFPYKEKCSGLVQDEVQYDEGEADYVEQVLYDKHDTTTSFFGDGGTSISTLPPFHLDVPPLVYGVEEEETCAATILVEADISYFESSDNQLVVDTEFASITLPNKPTGLQHYMDSKCIEYLEEGVKLIMLDIDSVASELMAGNKSVDEAIHDYISKLQFQNSAATFCHDNTCAMENLYRVVGHMHFIGSVMHFLVPNQKPHANSHASKQRSEWERSNEEVNWNFTLAIVNKHHFVISLDFDMVLQSYRAKWDPGISKGANVSSLADISCLGGLNVVARYCKVIAELYEKVQETNLYHATTYFGHANTTDLSTSMEMELSFIVFISYSGFSWNKIWDPGIISRLREWSEIITFDTCYFKAQTHRVRWSTYKSEIEFGILANETEIEPAPNLLISLNALMLRNNEDFQNHTELGKLLSYYYISC